MHTVTLGTQTKKVAATWDELEWPQLERLLPLYYAAHASPVRQRLEVLRVLLGISLPLLVRLTAVQLIEVSWLANFFLDEPVALTRQLLPVLRAGWWRRPLHGPTARLANLRFAEFVFADSFFVAYCQTQDTAWLDKLLAVLYRPARWWGGAGDRRQPFREHQLARNVRRVAPLPRVVKQAIYTWYLGCRNELADRYPLVFTAGDEQGQGHRDGWSYVWREVSGGPFGDFDATGRQHAHLVLAKMQDDLQRAAELKSQQPPT